jgi:hypothetical protein
MLQWPVAIGAVTQPALWQELLQALEQPLKHPMAQRRPAAHAFSAGDQYAQLTTAPQFQQHLHGYSRTAWQQGQGGIALIQPGEGSSATWIQLLEHQAQLPIARHSREDRFQTGQALRIKGL